jgi:hypothetical protein
LRACRTGRGNAKGKQGKARQFRHVGILVRTPATGGARKRGGAMRGQRQPPLPAATPDNAALESAGPGRSPGLQAAFPPVRPPSRAVRSGIVVGLLLLTVAGAAPEWRSNLAPASRFTAIAEARAAPVAARSLAVARHLGQVSSDFGFVASRA